MDLTAVSNLVSNIGFPVAMVLGLMWFIYQIFLKATAQNEINMKQIQERCAAREDKLYKELAEGREINRQAIDTIAHYAEKLDTIQSDISDIKTDIIIIKAKQQEANMKERILKLITVKSIVTIVLTLVFSFLTVTGKVSAEQFMNIFTVVIAFYFGTQAEKKAQTE